MKLLSIIPTVIFLAILSVATAVKDESSSDLFLRSSAVFAERNLNTQCFYENIGNAGAVTNQYNVGGVDFATCTATCTNAASIQLTLSNSGGSSSASATSCGQSVTLNEPGVKITLQATNVQNLELTCTCGDGSDGGNSGGGGCFAADTTVDVQGKGRIAMKNLQLGDLVQSAVGRYEPVYAYGHLNPTKTYKFLRLYLSPTRNGTMEFPRQNHNLEISPKHLVFIQGKPNPVTADSLKVGDRLLGSDIGTHFKIATIKRVTRRDGVYAPLTPSGTILVDGVRASTYVSLQKKQGNVGGDEYATLANGMALPFTQHDLIHMYTSPFRMVCLWSAGVTPSFCHSSYTDDGILTWVDMGIHFVEYAERQSTLVQVLVLLPIFMFCFLPFYTLEVGLMCVARNLSVWVSLGMATYLLMKGAAIFRTCNKVGLRFSKVKTV